jgi:hypothetical protein
MAKTYPELLGEWVKRRESAKRDSNLVAFLAVRDDVMAAVDAGYSVKTIWTNMHEAKRVSFGYDTFLNYVNRHIRRVGKDAPITAKAKPDLQTGSAQGPPEKKAKPPDPITGFTFNSAPKKEDLL